jgi:hypothetical protein
MKRDVSFDLPGGTITFKDVELPDANTPLPPTNATLHILSHENGYGTPDREFVAHCGTRWKSVGSTGEHKYFFEGDTQWFKHVNCERCRDMFGLDIVG